MWKVYNFVLDHSLKILFVILAVIGLINWYKPEIPVLSFLHNDIVAILAVLFVGLLFFASLGGAVGGIARKLNDGEEE